mmetsp:Transcript_15625/g.27690  ORF Transcript_15625/g.27690 Transcript_15625/m.27690 type:complete len:247 (+) Transcript_15625:700-1440(+)
MSQELASRDRVASFGKTWNLRLGRWRCLGSVHASAMPAREATLAASHGPASGSRRSAGTEEADTMRSRTSSTSPSAFARPVSSCNKMTPRLYTSEAELRTPSTKYCGSVCGRLLTRRGRSWTDPAVLVEASAEVLAPFVGALLDAIMAIKGDSMSDKGATGGWGVTGGMSGGTRSSAGGSSIWRRRGSRPAWTRRACRAPSRRTLPGCNAPCTRRWVRSAASPSAISCAWRSRVGHGRGIPVIKPP